MVGGIFALLMVYLVPSDPRRQPREHVRRLTDELSSVLREAADASWEVWDGPGAEWELGKVWAEKREIFYEQSKWKPLDNFT